MHGQEPTDLPDYYQLLGVSFNASEDEIRRAYRRMAMQWHPDRNDDPAAEEMMKKINGAWEILGDPESKAEYDRDYFMLRSILAEARLREVKEESLEKERREAQQREAEHRRKVETEKRRQEAARRERERREAVERRHKTEAERQERARRAAEERRRSEREQQSELQLDLYAAIAIGAFIIGLFILLVLISS